MRKVLILAVALFGAAAACEVAFPFDRTLIPEEGGAAGVDGSPPDLDEPTDAATVEDASPGSDAIVPSVEAGDAALSPDGAGKDATVGDATAGDAAVGEGTADGMSNADAGSEAAVTSEAGGG